MTLRLAFGIDPGNSGAIAVVADGSPAGFIDMPTKPREKGGGTMVDGRMLGAQLRGVILQHRGAHMVAAIERVQSRPNDGGNQGFRFGQADGFVRCAIELVLGVELIEVEPQTWKRHYGLLKQEKDASRALVLHRYPELSEALKRIKDGGRAEALLVALWALETEQWAKAA